MNGPEDTPTRFHHDWTEDDSISTTIVLAVSDLTETSLDELEPLSDIVRPDALDTLLRPGETPAGGDAPVAVSFEYEGYAVTVRRSGAVELRSVNDGR